jgi:hypothetical protein
MQSDQRLYRDGWYAPPPEGLSVLLAFFIAFQRDPRQFVAMQDRLAASDALNRHMVHTAALSSPVPEGQGPVVSLAKSFSLERSGE